MNPDRPDPTRTAIERAQRCARFWRRLGYNPLPSRATIKGPALATYADYWDTPVPDAVLDAWGTANLQLMTGVRWKLCVVDCDGDEAHHTWRRIRNRHGAEGPTPTWVARTGGGGWHYYFALPAWLDECPTRRLWGLWDTWGGPRHEGDWVKHKEVRLLGDRALVIAPPSVHVETGRAYEFMKGHGPGDYRRPALAPAWLLQMAGVVAPPKADEPPPLAIPTRPARPPVRPAGASYGRDDVLAAIADKAALARSWGLRIASRQPNPKGWYSCHAIDREDARPSASFHSVTGVYMELREHVSLAFFDLAAALGAYPTWRDAVDDLGARFACVPALARTRAPALAYAGAPARGKRPDEELHDRRDGCESRAGGRGEGECGGAR
jgi:hypothetical protein